MIAESYDHPSADRDNPSRQTDRDGPSDQRFSVSVADSFFYPAKAFFIKAAVKEFIS